MQTSAFVSLRRGRTGRHIVGVAACAQSEKGCLGGARWLQFAFMFPANGRHAFHRQHLLTITSTHSITALWGIPPERQVAQIHSKLARQAPLLKP